MADPSETIEVRSQRPEVNFHRIGAEEAGALAEAMGFESATSVRERFSDGRRCYVSRIEGAIAGYGWVSFEEEWISELGMSLRLEPGDAYIWDCATLPTYRGQGLYPALLTYILSSLWAKGLHRVWIGADTDSVASQKGIARAGFHPIADITLTGDPAPDHFFVSGHPGVPEELVRYIRDGLR
jgi:GNAT superfamily N-acetyltransferase